MALLPGDDVKKSGNQEEGAQAHPVHPGGEPLPAGVRQSVQQRHAHEGRHNEELKTTTKRYTTFFRCRLKTVKNIQAHRVSVAVSSMLVARGLVATVSRRPPVHKPETQDKVKNLRVSSSSTTTTTTENEFNFQK